MPRYIDGFVFPIKKTKLAAYRKIAAKAGKIWKEYGALEYIECTGDDLNAAGMPTTFPKLAKTKAGETVIFSYIVYKSRKHRDSVNKKALADPRLHEMCNPTNSPFDFRRMACGGFKAIVET